MRALSICTMPVSTRRCRARGGGRGVPAAAVAVLILAAALPEAAALYTKVKQGQQKCFIELLHAENVVVAEYRSPDQAPLPHDAEGQRGHVGVLFQVVNHRGKVYDTRLDTQGKLSFVTPDNGEHRLCFSVEGNSLGQDFRVHVRFDHLIKEENHDQIIKKEHLSGMDLRVRQLMDELDSIKDEQSYFRQVPHARGCAQCVRAQAGRQAGRQAGNHARARARTHTHTHTH